MGIQYEDNSRVEELLNQISFIKNKSIRIGILGEAGSDILMIANVNEFGVKINVTPKMRGYLALKGLHLKKSTTQISIPERSYMRGGFDANRNKIIDYAQGKLEDLFNFRITGQQYLDQVGLFCVGLIQDYLTNLREPPNHPYTIAKKGSSNPLVNTGRLRNSITYEVV